MAKQSTSQRIRKLLAQGLTVKEISKRLKCSTGLVYQVRAYDKKADIKTKQWKSGVVTTSAKPTVKDLQKRQQEAVLNQLARKPGAIRYGESVFIPLPHHHMKPTLWQRVKNFFTGC